MIDENLLSILACPESKKELELAGEDVIEKINIAIDQGKILTKIKVKVTERIDGGLYRKGDTKFIYPIRKGIPILLIDELISLENIS